MKDFKCKWIKKIIIFAVSLALVFQIPGGFLFVPQQASAATATWDFSTSSDYTFDDTKIEFSSGQTQLKATSNWYNTNWNYRKAITIDNTSNANELTNYQVNINLTGDNFNWSKALANGEDIRFTDSDGVTELDSWIETYAINNSSLWVEVPTISASSTKTIYLYYGLSTTSNLQGGFITDIHGVTDSGTKLGSNAVSNIGDFVTRMNNTILPDFTVDMGDKINNSNHDTDIANLQTIKNAFSSLNNNHYYTIGNHDWTNITKAELQTALGIDYNHKSVDVGNYHIIIIDAETDGNQATGMGHVSDEEKTWLTTELANTNKKTIVFSHQGLGDQSVALNYYFASAPDNAKVDNSSDIRTILENDGDVIAVFQGHTHWDNTTTINGIPYIYVNSLDENNANEWAEIDIYNNQLLNVVFRQNGNTKKFLVWDFANKKWFNKGSQVFSLFDDFDGDSGQWSAVAGSASNHWNIAQGGGYLIEDVGTSGGGGHRLLKSTYSESANYIAQVKIKASTTDNNTSGFSTRLASISNFNALYINSGVTTNYRWKQMKAGVWGAIADETTYDPDTDWHTLKMLKVGTSNTLYYDGASALSASSNNLSDSYFGLWNYNAAVSYDNLYIRSYTATEPTNSVGSEVLLYNANNPTINPTSENANVFTSLSGFSEAATKDDGEIKYQISNDSGATWYWYNSGWTVTTSGYTEANTASDVNSNIATFPTGDGEFLFKAYLHSDGTQLVQLDSVQLTYGANTAPSGTFDNDFSSWNAGNITVNYNFIDDQNDTLNISQTDSSGVEYSTDGLVWRDATNGGGISEGLTGLSSSASPGNNHIFVWNSSTDLPTIEDSAVYLRIRPNDGTISATDWVVSNAFGVDNAAPSSVGAPTFGTVTTSSIEVAKPGTVTENGSGLYQWQTRKNETTELGFSATSTNTVTSSGLLANTQYTYDVKFKDNKDNVSDYGTQASKYTLIQIPTGISFDSVGVNSLTVSAGGTLSNISTALSGLYFSETSGNGGGANSNWLQINSYQNTGLSENTQYTFKVMARNGNGTETEYTTTSSKYTLADTPTNLSATSDSSSITLAVDSFSNYTSGLSGYYFSRSGANSGWIPTNSWQDIGLSCGTSYTYSVKYRNGDSTETDPVLITKATSGCSGGGGGMRAGWGDQPVIPIGGFKMLVNLGASTTANRIVDLNFNASSDIAKMAISLTGDFSDAVQESYQSVKQFDICSKFGGVVINSSCPNGKYIIYAKFYTSYGTTSDVISQSIDLVTALQPVKSIAEPLKEVITEAATEQTSGTAPETISKPISELTSGELQNLPSAIFVRALYFGIYSNDVRRLQKLFTTNSEIYPEGLVTGYFGSLTKKAVQRFQLKYSLVTSRFDAGFGFVGPKTRAKLKEIFNGI